MRYHYEMEKSSDSPGWPALIAIMAGIAVFAWFVLVPILQRAGSPGLASSAAHRVLVEQCQGNEKCLGGFARLKNGGIVQFQFFADMGYAYERKGDLTQIVLPGEELWEKTALDYARQFVRK